MSQVIVGGQCQPIRGHHYLGVGVTLDVQQRDPGHALLGHLYKEGGQQSDQKVLLLNPHECLYLSCLLQIMMCYLMQCVVLH